MITILKRFRIKIFLILELVFYFIFLYIDLFHSEYNQLSVGIKFSGIVASFLFILSMKGFPGRIQTKSYLIEHKMDRCILCAALAFTVLSDYFILVREIFIPGVSTFILVQMLYLFRLWFWREREIKVNFLKIINLLLPNVVFWIGIIGILNVFSIQLEPLVLLTSFYFISLIRNTVTAIGMAVAKRSKSNVLFAIGLILFLLCDINVGIFNLSNFISIQNFLYIKLYNFSVIGMWLFYLPSQVLIALSGESWN